MNNTSYKIASPQLKIILTNQHMRSVQLKLNLETCILFIFTPPPPTYPLLFNANPKQLDPSEWLVIHPNQKDRREICQKTSN